MIDAEFLADEMMLRSAVIEAAWEVASRLLPAREKLREMAETEVAALDAETLARVGGWNDGLMLTAEDAEIVIGMIARLREPSTAVVKMVRFAIQRAAIQLEQKVINIATGLLVEVLEKRFAEELGGAVLGDDLVDVLRERLG